MSQYINCGMPISIAQLSHIHCSETALFIDKRHALWPSLKHQFTHFKFIFLNTRLLARQGLRASAIGSHDPAQISSSEWYSLQWLQAIFVLHKAQGQIKKKSTGQLNLWIAKNQSSFRPIQIHRPVQFFLKKEIWSKVINLFTFFK